MIFALVGNQNCGKTTLFNALTGANQHVGNFPPASPWTRRWGMCGVRKTAPLVAISARHLLSASLHPGGDSLPELHFK